MTPNVPKSPIEGLVSKMAASRFLTISALFHIVLILLFGGTVLFNKYVEPPDFTAEGGEFLGETAEAGPPAPDAPPPMPTAPAETVPTPTISAPAPSLEAIATTAPTMTGISIPIAMTPTLSKNITEMAAIPAAPKVGAAGAMPALPGAMANRGGARRAAAGAGHGMKQNSEQAVMNALRWLQTAQNPDGTWGGRVDNYDARGALTGLALLCFLGHGETPATSREFGIVVNKAIDALVAEGTRAQGAFSFAKGFPANPAPVYNHAIATYALCEAYTMTKDERLVPIVKQAVDHILKGQRSTGGWYYGYLTGGPSTDDNSVTGWHLQALKAAKLTGIPNDAVQGALDRGLQSVVKLFDPKDNSFSYRNTLEGRRGAKHFYSLTGMGALSILLVQGKADNMVRDAIKTIESVDVKYDTESADLYAWYYNTQACFMLQGGAWDRWNRRFQDELLKSQLPDGSWPPMKNMNPKNDHGGLQSDKNPNNAKWGLIYRTTLCTLMLEVYYRFLPTGKETAESTPGPSGL